MTHTRIDPEALRQAVLDTLRRIAPEVSPHALQPAKPFRDQVDLDSMDWLNFLVALHEKLGVDIPEADYAKLVTFDDLLAYLGTKLQVTDTSPVARCRATQRATQWIFEAISGRRSIREYTEEAVDERTIRRRIDAAVQAPNAVNQQPWTFTVVHDQTVLDRVSRDAKSHILATMPASQLCGRSSWTGHSISIFASMLLVPGYRKLFWNILMT